MRTNIYGLYNELNEIRYIGKTGKSIERRALDHLENSIKGDTSHRGNWIRLMRICGKRPIVKLIANVPGDGNEAERFYIAWFKMLGANLTNETEGGEGISGWHHDTETKKKISKASSERVRRPWTQEEKDRMRLIKLGQKHTKETREKISKNHSKYAGKKKGSKDTKAVKLKKKEALILAWREGRHTGMSGKTKSLETREKHRLAALAQWKRQKGE